MAEDHFTGVHFNYLKDHLNSLKDFLIRSLRLPLRLRHLFDYSPETILVEDSTVLDVLKVSDMTMKLVDEIKDRLGPSLDVMGNCLGIHIW